MPNCIPPGWGNAGWGWDPWGGGGPLFTDLPVHPPFDVYCVGPCDEIEHIFQFFLVTGSANLLTDPLTGNLVFDSGGLGVDPPELWLEIAKTVPTVWTLEFTCKFHNLPPQLTSVQLSMGRIFVGCWNEEGGAAGLFFSADGIGYAGRPDEPIIPIPNSSGIINETDFWTIRIVSNPSTGALFVYMTKSSELELGSGHALRFVLPLPAQVGSHQERTYFSVQGSAQIHNKIELQGVCLATGPVIPNMPPVADAGNEQEVKLCTIGMLDGSASFDPEGSPITYHWRVVDIPVTSKYVYEGFDGWTEPDISGYTSDLHTRNNLDPLAGGWDVAVGDVVTFKGVPYTIQSVITLDPLDQIIRIEGSYLTAGEAQPHYFKVVKQKPLINHTIVNPTFYPDAPGFWKFDLMVSDGFLFSELAVTVVSVRESPVPRGCTPDLTFLWDYLSDFWQLVEGKETISTIWSAIAQVTASELMKLWQIDFNKSLRDIQRTMVRKWLYYDLLVQEPFFDLTRVPCLNVPDGFLSGADGQVLPAQPPFPWAPLPLPFQMNPYGYRTNVRLDDKGLQRGDLLVLNGKGYRIDKVLPEPAQPPPWVPPPLPPVYRGELVLLDPIYEVPPAGPLPSITDWMIIRPVTSSQIDFWGGLVTPGDNAVVEVLDKQTGNYQFFKCPVVGLCEQVPHGVAVDPTQFATYALDATKRYELYFVGVFRRGYVPISDRLRDIPYLQQKIKDPPVDEVLQRNVDFFIEQFRGRTCIRFSDVWQHQELDTTVDPPVLIWVEDPTPPARLWGEFNYVENLSVVESNFGVLAGLTVKDLDEVDQLTAGDIDYLSAIQGMWFVYFNAATPWNLRVGAQILLGLPYAEEDGTILDIIQNLNVSATRLLVEDVGDNGIVRAYDYPDGLQLENNPLTGLPYQVGDTIRQFAPISTGVEVVDYIKDPYWIAPYIGQGALYEIQKYFYFPVIIESEAFTLPGALLTRQLILNTKPSYTYPIIVTRFEPTPCDIDVEDACAIKVTLSIHEGGCMHQHVHPTMWNAGDSGPTTMFPQPETVDSVFDIWHRHESYPGWFSSWKSQYGVKDYPDVGYADFYEEAVVAIAFPHSLPTMPKPDGSTAMFVQAEDSAFTVKSIYVEVTPNTIEPAPVYTIELLYGGVPFFPPVTADFTVALLPGETTFRTTIALPAPIMMAGNVPLTAVLTVGPGGSGTPDWDNCRFIFYMTYWYVSPQMWGYYGGTQQPAYPPAPHPWPYPNPNQPYQGADNMCPEASLEVTMFMLWPAPQVVQFNTIFIMGDPVYPAYLDTTGPDPVFVIDWANPTNCEDLPAGRPGWSYGQILPAPPLPYLGYASKKFV